MDFDVRLLLFSQSGCYERQGGMEAPSHRWCFKNSRTKSAADMAKSKLEGSLKEAGAKLRSGLEDLKSLGKADPAQIIIAFSVDCVPK